MQDNEPQLVSAVVINLNGSDLLPHAITSLQKQHYDRLDIIVVDNGSTDGSQDMLRADFPDVCLVENRKNLGFGGANNIGIEHALRNGARYVFLLNYDATIREDCVSRMVETMEKNGPAIIGAKIYYHEPPDRIWSAGGTVTLWSGRIAHRGIRKLDEDRYNRRMHVDYVTACTMLIHRSVIETIGYFDDVYFPSYCEDVDLCRRADLSGFPILYEPEAVAWHRVSSHSGGGITALKVRLRVRNEFIVFKRYAHWYNWITIPVCTSARFMMFTVRWLLSGQWKLLAAGFRGFLSLFRTET